MHDGGPRQADRSCGQRLRSDLESTAAQTSVSGATRKTSFEGRQGSLLIGQVKKREKIKGSVLPNYSIAEMTIGLVAIEDECGGSWLEPSLFLLRTPNAGRRKRVPLGDLIRSTISFRGW